jgi:thymidylate synthase ThyX
MDGDAAPRNTPVNMIYDVNAEELMTVANKRLCSKAAEKTREVVAEMCRLAAEVTPELKTLLVPECDRHGVCFEMYPCYMRHEK